MTKKKTKGPTRAERRRYIGDLVSHARLLTHGNEHVKRDPNKALRIAAGIEADKHSTTRQRNEARAIVREVGEHEAFRLREIERYLDARSGSDEDDD